MLEKMADTLNETALLPLTKHNVLDMVIDRAFAKMFPQEKLPNRKKKYHRFDG